MTIVRPDIRGRVPLPQNQERNRATSILSAVFFLSGASALLFETVWFRLAGLAFGNSVWSAALVTSAFMAGLALGGALIARHGFRLAHPLKSYAGLELIIALAGMSLVVGLPIFETSFTGIFAPLLDRPIVLNLLRLAIAFIFLVIPSTAMGATLPLLVKVMADGRSSFGWALGRLYGWNTLGAVVGALSGELFLIRHFGLRSTGLCAALLNVAAALIVQRLSPRLASTTEPPSEPSERNSALPGAAKRLLAAAFLCGFIVLALEVIWFRLLQLVLVGSSLVFALMLAIILAGISVGGLLAARWNRRNPVVHEHLTWIALSAGICTTLTYAKFGAVYNVTLRWSTTEIGRFVLYSTFLMIPVAILSGMLFTLLGNALERELRDETRAAGLLTLLNTSGSMFGALIAGFVLLPGLGTELSIFLLGALYAAVALLVSSVTLSARARSPRFIAYAAFTLFAISIGLFPFGRMNKEYFSAVSQKYPGATAINVREGANETIFYMRYEKLGELSYYRMVTNGFSMSGTSAAAQRYMKLYVYWPFAVHQGPKTALLISYGVGSTAKALTDTSQLQSIDIVDISKDILELNSIVYPNSLDNPLYDKRVRVHIEDGRFFLRTTNQRFDLITSEPPPPKLAGVVNLYSQEYFQLMYDRLNPGGFVTYWLPVGQLYEKDAKAIIKAFCNVYPDCSLWAAAGLEWMLVGSRDSQNKNSEEQFTRQWRDPKVSKELHELGIERPEQLGAMFMADAAQLHKLTANTLPVTDNFPLRISPEFSEHSHSKLYAAMMWEDSAKQRFLESKVIQRLWPDGLRAATPEQFTYQRMLKHIFLPQYRTGNEDAISELYRVLNATQLKTLPLWQMGTSVGESRAAESVYQRGNRSNEVLYFKAREEIANRNYSQAAVFLNRYLKQHSTGKEGMNYPRYLLLWLSTASDFDRAKELVELFAAPGIGEAGAIAEPG